MVNDNIIRDLQKLVSSYKRESSNPNKLLILWDIGDILIKNRITKHGKFWQIQNKEVYVSRAMLLRSYWVRGSLTKEEIMKIRIPMSKILPFLPYLAKRSKKLDKTKKQKLKLDLINNIVPDWIKFSKKSRERKIESYDLAKQMKGIIVKVPIDEIESFNENLGKDNLSKLKKLFIMLLSQEIPEKKDKEIIENVLDMCKEKKLLNMEKIFLIIKTVLSKTRQDSRVLMKRLFDPYLILPFLEKTIFKKEI